jgi:hypothetical protein
MPTAGWCRICPRGCLDSPGNDALASPANQCGVIICGAARPLKVIGGCLAA